jgi:hypothetical protein
MKRSKRGRTAKRSLARDREKLLRLEPGGSPARPIEVSSASLVEPKVALVHCPECDAPLAVNEHAAVVRAGVRLREVSAVCRVCGVPRTLWFRIVPVLLN